MTLLKVKSDLRLEGILVEEILDEEEIARFREDLEDDLEQLLAGRLLELLARPETLRAGVNLAEDALEIDAGVADVEGGPS